ncbi:hypothetical protein AKO1_014343 [Acrasis kona]|uniref:Coronin n=1 Tax=Acrasis kona TaxID=1008807 RepID=A0AAW2YYP6_9EUKA
MHRRTDSNKSFTGRHSRFKNIIGKTCKKELWFTNFGSKVNKSAASAESTVISASPTFFALPYGSYGQTVVTKYKDVAPTMSARKTSANPPLLGGNNGLVHDTDFSPFELDNDVHLIASGSADGSVRAMRFSTPSDLHPTCDEATQAVTMKGHIKKTHVVRWHPTVTDVIVSASYDQSVRIWDVNAQKEKILLNEDFGDIVQSLDWNWPANALLTSCRDGEARLYDPRTQTLILGGKAHEGKKGFRGLWIGKKDQFFTVGFNAQNQRQFALWDLRKGMKRGALTVQTLVDDHTSSQLFPFLDEGNQLIYLAGIGDNKIRCYEIDDSEDPFIHYMNEYVGETTQSGITMLPKRMCDPKTYEIARFVKYNGEAVEFVSFHVPRKEGGPNGKQILFQEDIYPPVFTGQPTNDSTFFFEKLDDQPPKLTNMQPADLKSIYEMPEDQGGKRRVLENFTNIPISEPSNLKKQTSSLQSQAEIIHSGYVLLLEDEYGRDPFKKRFVALRSKKESKFLTYGNHPDDVHPSREFNLDHIVCVNRCKQLRDLQVTDDQCFEIYIKQKSSSGPIRVITVACSMKSESTQWIDILTKKTNMNSKKAVVHQDYILEWVPPNGDDVVVGYWSKRWIVALPDRLLIFSTRKSFVPKKEFATIKKHSQSVNNAIMSIFPLDQSNELSLEADEKRLCAQITTNDKSKHFLLFTNDIQKEMWTEDLLSKIGQENQTKKTNKDRVQSLLLQLGLSDHDTFNDDDSSESSDPFTNMMRKEERERRTQGPAHLSVFPISDTITTDDVQSLFSAFGTVQHVELHKSGKFAHHAIITFSNQEEAGQATCLDQSVLDGERITVKSIQLQDTLTPGFLKIEKVHLQMTKKDFQDMFSAFGEIEHIKLWPTTDNLNNTGYIKFRDLTEAQTATALSGATVFGQPLIVTLLDNKSMSNSAQEKLFSNVIDPQQVKANQQICLIQIKGNKKIRSRRVELNVKSLNQGDVFVLDCGTKIYQFNGIKSTRFKRARGLDVASNIRLKERGGNAKIYFLDQKCDDDVEESLEMKEFWNHFGITKNAQLTDFRNVEISTAEQGGDDDVFESWIDAHTFLYRINSFQSDQDESEASLESDHFDPKSVQVNLVHEKSQPSKAMFRGEFVYVLDCYTEIFIWEGSHVNKSQRQFGRLFATKLEQSNERPLWTGTTKVIQNGETVLFKEKLSDYAGVLPIAMSGGAGNASAGSALVATKKPQPPINLYSDNAQLTPIVDPMFGRFDSDSIVVGSKWGGNVSNVEAWVVDGFERVEYPQELIGEFYSADSFVLLINVSFISGKEGIVALMKRVASALLTVDVSNLTQDDAPQIRITQQHETNHFLSLFPGHGIIIHSGKYLERINRAPVKKSAATAIAPIVYDIRARCDLLSEQFDKDRVKLRAVECVQSDQIDGGLLLKNRLGSDRVSVVSDHEYNKIYLHLGECTTPFEREFGALVADKLRASTCFVKSLVDKRTVIKVEQGQEPPELLKLMGMDQTLAVSKNKVRIHPRLFSFAYATGVVVAEHVHDFCQDDLDLSQCYLLDCVDKIYLWMSATVIPHEYQKTMLEVTVQYFKESIHDANSCAKAKLTDKNFPAFVNDRGHEPDAKNVLIVSPCLEPLEFTRHFHGWGPHRSRYLSDLYQAIVSNQGQAPGTSDSATPSLVRKTGPVKKVTLVRQMASVMERLDDYTRKTYPYDVLLSTPLPIGIDSTKLEQYLSLEEFETVFGMTKEQFDKTPVWKQEQLKKQRYLF